MISAIIVGLFVGAVAKFIMPGKDPGGLIITCLLGIAGAAVAHFIGTSAGYYLPHEPAGVLGSVLGAMLVLFCYRILLGRTTESREQ